MAVYQGTGSPADRVLPVVMGVAGVLMGIMFTWQLSQDFNRRILAQVLVAIFAILSLTIPRIAIGLIMIYLTVMGDLRRYLAVVEGQTDFDLLLVVAPVGVILMFISLFMRGELNTNSKIGRWVLVLMIIMGLQLFNTYNSTLRANFAGALFYIIPLLWFWVGQAYGTREFLHKILFRPVLFVCMAACIFGLYQVFVDFPEYQKQWYRDQLVRTGMVFTVGERLRPFAFLVSFAEYAGVIALTIVLCMSAVLLGRLNKLVLFLPIPLLALFTQGGRGAIITSFAALAMMWALQAKGSLTSVGRLILFGGIIVVGLYFGLTASMSGNLGADVSPMVQRQAEGLLNPLDPTKSTGQAHFFIGVSGIIRGITQPVGEGLGSTTIAAGKFGDGSTGGTEKDITNMFASLGVVGGVVYAVLMFLILKYAIRYLRHTRTPEAIAIVGVLISQFLQWLNGGHYAISAIVWFCIGALDRQVEEEGLTLPLQQT